MGIENKIKEAWEKKNLYIEVPDSRSSNNAAGKFRAKAGLPKSDISVVNFEDRRFALFPRNIVEGEPLRQLLNKKDK